MPKRMLIDATHPEETRVVVLSGTRLEEFDFESSTKRQVKGNIYLAKITRVEPSLQAAFVDYGGSRHGFLAFSEIHPDYYRIPVSDRQHAAAGSSDESGDRTHDNRDNGDAGDPGAADSDDAGVPLASALPEPVAVPPTEDEDDAPGDESHGEAAAEQESAEEVLASGEDDRWEPRPSDHPLRDDSSTPAADDRGDAAADVAMIVEPDARPQSAILTAEASFFEQPTSTEFDARSEFAAPVTESPYAEAPTISVPQPDRTALPELAGEPAASDEECGDTPDAGREPATIALRAAEEPAVALEIPETEGAEPAGETGQQQYGEPNDREGEAPGNSDGHDHSVEFADGEHDSNGADGDVVPDTVETLGGDEVDEVEEDDAAERRRRHPMRHYKIQEVIKRRQIMLVQVAKEERGNKGAALTTYLSLAGRYCVLMPNTNRGGGVSRKITSLTDRRRLKDILEELDIPEGMGVIVRTAGAERSKAEIKRDYEYLLRLWNEIRDLTLRSTAPALIYEEGNLIKRSIRDLYTRDIDEVLVEGEEGYRTAKAFMRTLMPSHAKRVQPYRDPQIGLFHRFQVESQIDAIHSPVAQLRSGGYLVFNQAEALVAIDVNSGRSTRERNIEETALRTNLEAADEIARQLRLRDLAGLIVIDFIDMEEHRNQIAVERRLKEALKNDRARIQVGRISPFGLLEMSRQRLRPSLTETSTQPCPHCGGTGFIRSVESTALHVLRSIEEEGIRRRSAEICIYVPTTVALYILNQKRESLNQIESRYTFHVMVARDDSLIPPAFRLERLRAYSAGEAPPVRPIQAPVFSEVEEEDESEDAETELAAGTEPGTAESGEAGSSERDRAADEERGRRRRRRRRRRDEPRETRRDAASAGAEEVPEGVEADGNGREEQVEAPPDGETEAEHRRRRRGRRGGRLRPRRDEHREERQEESADAEAAMPVAAETIEIVAADAPPAEAETISLDPWSARYGVETASLAPFAGEPAVGAPSAGEQSGSQPPGAEPAAESGREGPGTGVAEAEAMPIAEAEEGVPFVSGSERELEAAEAADHPAPLEREPARTGTGIEPDRAVETGLNGPESNAAADSWPPAEPEYAEKPPGPPTAADIRDAESAGAEIACEPASAAAGNAVSAPVPSVADEPAVAEPAVAELALAEPESVPTEPAAAPQSRPAEDVLVITEKPANPRRGWWQRMMRP